ncbi:receptor-like protein 53 isoform X1 [Andrographis paniculata]|uniref:receptor-like protein 53 isoform X1 n=1 Tax=Andrographis paniculata TaxID=175694 RepID=UPI0021E7113F|nr:receptor-like protein 53 isoform X1 [Andrographis paniculata]
MLQLRMKCLMLSSTFLIHFLLLISDFGIGIIITFAAGQCVEDQKDLLLELRNNLTYDSSLSTKLVQWNDSIDCCRWAGVKCDTKGRVSGLDLSNESISNGIHDASSNLFRLRFLQSLNLAGNTFDSVEFPSGFEELTELRYLNLSNSGFTGQIPPGISNLTRLVVLDLSSAYTPVNLENPNLERLIQKLNRLQELYLEGVNASAIGSQWCNALSLYVPNLRVLSMPNAYLTGPFDSSLLKLQSLSIIRLDGNIFSAGFPEFLADFAKLQVLILSSCGLSGVVPAKLFQIKSLEKIDLNNNRDLEGSLPEFPSNGSLRTLQLQYTRFSGNLTDSVSRLGMLEFLDLRACLFSGTIPGSIEKLTHLQYLDLSLNQFVGSVPSFAFRKKLTTINLRGNSLTGRIPDAIWKGLESLEFLDLSVNSLHGEVPASLFDLPSLKILDLSNNSFSSLIGDAKTGPSSSLEVLELSINKFHGSVPEFLFDLKNLSTLSLSQNKFNGSVNLFNFRKLKGLVDLDLSYNSLSVFVDGNVSISSMFPKLGYLMLASCKVQKFPLLKNQSSLMMLDLSDNQIHGEIPNWLWEVSDGLLRHLNLSNNYFTHLQQPYSLRNVYLDYLNLHSNLLGGQVPIPPASVYYLDLSNNEFSSVPVDIGNSIKRALFVSLANNRIGGAIPISLCNATNLQILDLSNMSLHGEIPVCLSELNLKVLNLRRNNLRGVIPDTFRVECALETLDLNRNFFRGEVPKTLERCVELEVLDLGNNAFDGTFPCWLKNLPKLRVLVLRSNKFHGNVTCLNDGNELSNLQIIDVASNRFDGVLPARFFSGMNALIVNADGALDHLYFVHGTASDIYYQDSVTLTLKGSEVEYRKILDILTSIDFSSNRFEGRIPEMIGDLENLYVLNFSKNSLSGDIPGSIGNLKNLGSLDLSSNDLGGEIPSRIADLTFLSSMNLSFNRLVGRIPHGRQMSTFSESSFVGNEGLCGFPLNKSCGDVTTRSPSSSLSPLLPEEEDDGERRDVGLYASAAFGYFVGVAIVVLSLAVSRRWRKAYNRAVDRFVLRGGRRPDGAGEEW